MEEGKEEQQGNPEHEEIAKRRAKQRAYAARWNLDIAVLAFAVLILIIILLSQGLGLEIVGPVAVLGLAMVWLCGWRQGRKLYRDFYQEELDILEREEKKVAERPAEESVEELIQKALRERWK